MAAGPSHGTTGTMVNPAVVVMYNKYDNSCLFVFKFTCLKFQPNLTRFLKITANYSEVHFLSGHTVSF